MSSQEHTKNTLRILKGQKLHPLALSLREFLLDCQSRNLSPGTLRFYRQKLEPFLAFMLRQGIAAPKHIEPAHLRQFLLSLQETHNAGGQHGYYRALRAFFSWLVAEGEIDVNPLKHVKAPRVPEEILEPAKIEHIRAMLQACNRQTEIGCRDYSLILALMDTGARAGEILAMNLGDLDIKTGAIVIRRSKSRRPRVVFLGTRSLKALLRYLSYRGDAPDNAPLWANREGGRLSYSSLRDILRRRAKQAGVQAPSLHAFRRTFTLAMLRGGADVLSISRLLGHADLSVLKRYAKQVADDLKQAHERFGPVDKLLAWLAMLGAAMPALRLLAQRG